MKKVTIWLLTLLFVFSASACGAAESTEEIYVENVGMICGLGPVGLNDRFAGVIVSSSETKIEKTEAKIDEMCVKVGDEVKAGDTLFTYDSEAMEFDLIKYELELERQKLDLGALEEDKVKLEAEKAKAKADQQLAYSLEIRETEAKILESQYNMKLKEQEIAKAKEALENTIVTSPVTGRIQAINEEGAYDDNGFPLPFMSIVEEGTFRCMGYVNEMNIGAIMEGTAVLLHSRVDDQIWHGFVSEIDLDNASAGGSQTMYVYYDGMDETGAASKYPFYVEIDDVTGLMLGQHVYIEPDNGESDVQAENVMLLPAYYIVDADAEPFVYAEGKNNRLEKRPLTLSAYDEMTDCWIVEAGLDAGDYIAFPSEDVKEGMICTTSVLSEEMTMEE